jgi:glyoxylase-like metal-dependent hydrolase (beta-lactamase superfamily II)
VTAFVEVADRVWVARQEWYDLNVCLVRGSDGLLVVDTQASAAAARRIVEDVRALGVGEVTAIVNTHEHFDHTFGNGAFRAAYGEDCHPLDWPGTLDVVLNLVGHDTVVVPGHGALVDRDFVEQQRQDIAIVAQTVRDLAAAGVPVDRALDEGEWPLERTALTHAVTRGYAHLPPGGRALPLAW